MTDKRKEIVAVRRRAYRYDLLFSDDDLVQDKAAGAGVRDKGGLTDSVLERR
jgi:hypothetical protein